MISEANVTYIESITEWQHLEHPGEWWDLPAYPMSSPHNPLYNWIQEILTLREIPLDNDILLDREPWEYGYPGDNSGEEEMRQWRQRVEDARKERTIKEIYVQCGWKVDAAEKLEEANVPMWEAIAQAHHSAREEFQGDQFEQRREEWKKRVWGQLDSSGADNIAAQVDQVSL